LFLSSLNSENVCEDLKKLSAPYVWPDQQQKVK